MRERELLHETGRESKIPSASVAKSSTSDRETSGESEAGSGFSGSYGKSKQSVDKYPERAVSRRTGIRHSQCSKSSSTQNDCCGCSRSASSIKRTANDILTATNTHVPYHSFPVCHYPMKGKGSRYGQISDGNGGFFNRKHPFAAEKGCWSESLPIRILWQMFRKCLCSP
jgi:hypothetical protein